MIKLVTQGRKEIGWGDRANAFNGCSRDCLYCYAKYFRCYRFRQIPAEQWSQMKLKPGITAKKWPKPNPRWGRYMFPTAHDITNNPWVRDPCFAVIQSILQQGYEILIVTKPEFEVIKLLCLIFRQYREKIELRFTITSADEKLLKFWEPNAPSFRERFFALKHAYLCKFKTSVSIEPFLDNNPIPLIKRVAKFCDTIWIGPMNYIEEFVKENVKEAGQSWPVGFEERYSFENLYSIYQVIKKYPQIRFKDAFLNEIEAKVGVKCNQRKTDNKIPRILMTQIQSTLDDFA